MAEITTPQAETSAPAPLPVKPPAKRRNGRKVRNIIISCIILAALAVGGYFLYQFLTKQDEVQSEIQSQFVSFGSIQSMVTGSGNAKAKESAAITLTASGTVREVLVAPGDIVTTGQPLYTIFSQEAQDTVTSAQEKVSDAQEKVNDLNKDLESLQEKVDNLTVRAPFSGKIIEVADGLEVEKKLVEGAEIAKLVNDRKLKVSLYFSYAYEDDIFVGQDVSVSIPAVMGSFAGKVEKINKVSYISPEGAVHFEVVVAFENQGTLTAGMNASAVLTAADGVEIYPYADAQTEYYETRTILTKAEGPIEKLGALLLNHANVEEGEELLVLGSSTLDDQIREKRNEITEAQEKVSEAVEDLNKAIKSLDDFNAVAPIDGTVASCTLVEGADVKSGDTVITISNTTNMVVDITVDDRNIAFVQPGMMVQLSDWNGNMFMGTVSSINMASAESNNGMTSYPVTLEVDNFDGSLLAGQWLDYSFVASQSDECMMVPMQSVKMVSDVDGETYSVVFIKADSKPENTVELDIPEVMPGETPQYPTEKDGYYPVPVETGLSDNYNIEVTSGLNGDEEVFMNFYVESAWG